MVPTNNSLKSRWAEYTAEPLGLNVLHACKKSCQSSELWVYNSRALPLGSIKDRGLGTLIPIGEILDFDKWPTNDQPKRLEEVKAIALQFK